MCFKINSECVILKWKGNLNSQGSKWQREKHKVEVEPKAALVSAPRGERPDFNFTSTPEQLTCWRWSHKSPESWFSQAFLFSQPFTELNTLDMFSYYESKTQSLCKTKKRNTKKQNKPVS